VAKKPALRRGPQHAHTTSAPAHPRRRSAGHGGECEAGGGSPTEHIAPMAAPSTSALLKALTCGYDAGTWFVALGYCLTSRCVRALLALHAAWHSCVDSPSNKHSPATPRLPHHPQPHAHTPPACCPSSTSSLSSTSPSRLLSRASSTLSAPPQSSSCAFTTRCAPSPPPLTRTRARVPLSGKFDSRPRLRSTAGWVEAVNLVDVNAVRQMFPVLLTFYGSVYSNMKVGCAQRAWARLS
jgi:hypothetical protein